MIVKLKWNEEVRFLPLLKIISIFCFYLGIKMATPKIFIVKSTRKEKAKCLCDKCNTNYEGHYGVGYYSCKNSDKVIIL